MEKILLAIIFILILLIIISIIICFIKIDISTYNIINSKIDKNIRIMFLSDLHNNNIYKKLNKILDSTKPDIIICGGDMINEGLNRIDNFMKIIPLFKNYKTFYTFGNHEEVIHIEKIKDYKKYIKYINKTNIILVNNNNIDISKNIKLYGLNPRLRYYKKHGMKGLDKSIINKYIGSIDNNKFNILVSHNPLEFDSYVELGCDLVLSGHVHAGVVRIPFLGALLSPDYTLFPKYSEGKYEKDNTTMIVSRGLGFSAKIPIRINNNPEIVIINLKNK